MMMDGSIAIGSEQNLAFGEIAKMVKTNDGQKGELL
jgi:hypothetical protein